MKRVIITKKIIRLLLLCSVLSSFWSPFSWGATVCSSDKAGYADFQSFSQSVYGQHTPADTSYKGNNYAFTCECSGSITNAFNFYADVDPSLTKINVGDGQYYKFADNDYLAVYPMVQFDDGSAQKPLPQSGSYDPGTPNCNNIPAGRLASGHMKVTTLRKLRNDTSFDEKVYNIYASPDSTPTSGPTVFTVHIRGSIWIPQGCFVQSGQVMSIDFNELYSGDFNQKGAKPDGAKIKEFTIPVECNAPRGDTGLHAKMRIIANADKTDSDAIATNNPDVGVIVADTHGNILKPNSLSHSLPFTTDQNGKAFVPLEAYPVSTTGKQPAEGRFDAVAYLFMAYD